MNRILNLDILEETFENNHNEIPSISHTNSYKTEYKNIKLSFSKKLAFRVFDEFNNDYVCETENRFLVTLKIPIDEWIIGYILSFGEYVKVVEPKELREKIINQAKKIYENHSIN